ncbi:sensor histidine kinase [Actinomadura livida]|uniref:Sensor-like histidine kinase SenX3 n=1 Tax=Actinomadura livida TaxID=79909 RepID=A0A7W7MVS3_9ACTN|nr:MULTISPECIES: ATP-binding protein [Actinomadura]MBB4772911.1 two-component system sensor histidine kinase SenX3 [Actinomadura catellatispora]GGU13612.1 two-component sensor histidine kinase [Actinomadura livida]
MEVEVVAVLTGLAGLAIGLTTGLAVRVSERSHRVAAPATPVGVLPPGVASVLSVLRSSAVVVDVEDRVLRASSAARAYGLVSGDRLVVDEVLAMARLVRRDGEIRETEIQVGSTAARSRADGRWFAVRVTPLGSHGLVLVLAEDLTDMHRTEAIRRDFVANVSHELKTPVGALWLLAETVENAADDPEAVRRFAGRMQYESVRLTNLVQDLMTLSRVQGDEPLPDLRSVSVDEVVAEALEGCRTKASAKEIELAAGGEDGLRVHGDQELLVSALRNLVDNAVAYSPENTRVVVSARRCGDDQVEVNVTDQGIGIPDGEVGRIFERFYRVDPARSRQTGGTGLGLAIVKHVTGKHGGDVTVWSKEGHGSTFTIRLPLLGTAAGGTAARKDADAENNTDNPAQEAP